jgi:DNA adenine methylase
MLDNIVIFGDDLVMRYPGGKGKCFQHIINAMPPHSVYIESHLGGGAVMRHKAPARRSIGVDIDGDVIARFAANYFDLCDVVQCDATEYLMKYEFLGGELVYADPPYVRSTRKSARSIYRHEYSDEDHEALLLVLKRLPCMVIVSGYANELYRDHLASWRSGCFKAKSHTSIREETLWMNFPAPKKLHDARFCGQGFRERQVIKRRQERLIQRFDAMCPIERNHTLSLLHDRYLSECAQ